MTVPSIRYNSEQKYEVTPLELFFDLVFVFAVSQLSHHLLTHLSWRGAVETLVMLLAIFGVWFTTSWSATIIRADQSRTRWMILMVMLLSLFMNASVTRAFTTSGWAFVVPLLLIQLGPAVWTLVNSADAVFRDHYFRVLLWLIATTPLWIAGAIVSPGTHLLWWALAAGLDLLGRWLAHPIPGRWLRSENVPFDADHMLERCRLFLLIALGETVFTTGMAIAAAPYDADDSHHGHVRAGRDGRPVVTDLWAFLQAHASALGEHEGPYSHQPLCGKRSDGHGGRTDRRGGRK